jgi:hypothetical protein
MPKSDITTALTEPSFYESFFNMSQDQISTCSMFNFKLILLVIFVLILVCILTSCLASLFAPAYEMCDGSCCEDCKGPCGRNCKCGCMYEKFSNDVMFSYKDSIKANYSNYQSTSLTPSVSDEGNPNNMLFGQANRIITSQSKVDSLDGKVDMILHLNVFCNLFVINGNPFGEKSVIQEGSTPQKYLVYIKNNKGQRELLDELTKDGDGIYKLKFVTKNADQIKKLLGYNQIDIVYTINNKEIVILSGKFTLQ